MGSLGRDLKVGGDAMLGIVGSFDIIKLSWGREMLEVLIKRRVSFHEHMTLWDTSETSLRYIIKGEVWSSDISYHDIANGVCMR